MQQRRRGRTEKGAWMLRTSMVLLFAGGILICHTAAAQCRGGAGVTAGTGMGVGTTAAGSLTSGGAFTGTSRTLAGPGSLAYDAMLTQMMVQQMAQQQYMLAIQQQKLQQERLAQRQYRAEQSRAATAESRARTRAALAAANGLTPKTPAPTLVAYQPVR